jgi:hypothetical protein
VAEVGGPRATERCGGAPRRTRPRQLPRRGGSGLGEVRREEQSSRRIRKYNQFGVRWSGGGLHASMAGRGLIGAAEGKLHNWSLALHYQRRGGVERLWDLVAELCT